jgi:cytochrome d ubiquinol oxidase subunit II
MEILWFCIVAFMIAVYAILDGFDLGSGIVHLFTARSDAERRTIVNAIGPVWDGNEVWLIAAGGTLYFAFPFVYASSFSGFYLPLMIVLWLFILRALGIEFRHQVHHPLWKAFWDASFSTSSLLLSFFLGAALGNVLRGAPLRSDGYFFEPLWTHFSTEGETGILDWFTILMGLVSLFTLAAHGAHYIALKTEGVLRHRAHRTARRSWWGVVASSAGAVVAISIIRPNLLSNFGLAPWGLLFPAAALAGLGGMRVFSERGNDRNAFLSSSLFIGAMLASTAFGLFPLLLPATTDPARSLTAYNAISGSYGLAVGIVWWSIAAVLATGYFLFLFRSFRGKVSLPAEEEGY